MASGKVVCSLPAQSFFRKEKSNLGRANGFNAVPFYVEFQRLFRQANPDSIIPGISIQDLLCIVVALYDVNLPNIGVEDLRANICARGAKTIILVRDEIEIIGECKQKTSGKGKIDSSTTAIENFFTKKEEKIKHGPLSAIFSDSESSDEDKEAETESDREGKEKFNTGMREFLTCVQRRQQRRQMQEAKVSISSQSIGIESRIVAAMTFKRSVLKTKEVVIQLTLLSTRKRYRRCGVGKYMVKLLRDPSVVGIYDAVLTHADSGAVTFFSHCGFSDDILLNSKFREFEDDWTNTTTMSFFPPFNMDKEHLMNNKDIELEMEHWNKRNVVFTYGDGGTNGASAETLSSIQ